MKLNERESREIKNIAQASGFKEEIILEGIIKLGLKHFFDDWKKSTGGAMYHLLLSIGVGDNKYWEARRIQEELHPEWFRPLN